VKNNDIIPKIIWMYWHQGIDNAPFLVKECIKSWKLQNPNYDIRVLDVNSIREYIEVELPKHKKESMVLANYSDLLRMKLLYEYGGIWADATSYCMKPIDSWISPYVKNGFFAFVHNKPQGLIASWFIISNKNCLIMKETYEKLLKYWQNNNLTNKGPIKRYIRKWAGKLLNHHQSRWKYWFHPFTTKVLKIHPYFVMHYLMDDLISTNEQARTIWESTKKLDDIGPHKLKRIGFLNKLDANSKHIIDNEDIPMFKLTYKKYDHSRYTQDSILYYLFEGRFNNKGK
jgi:hypothetical protein